MSDLEDLCNRLTKPLNTTADVEQLYRDRFLAANSIRKLADMLHRAQNPLRHTDIAKSSG